MQIHLAAFVGKILKVNRYLVRSKPLISKGFCFIGCWHFCWFCLIKLLNACAKQVFLPENRFLTLRIPPKAATQVNGAGKTGTSGKVNSHRVNTIRYNFLILHL